MRKKQERSAPRPAGMLFWGLAGLLMLAPLPLGSARPLPAAALILGTALLLGFWAFAALRNAATLTVRWRRMQGLALGAGLLFAWFAIQISGLTPAAWDHPLWAAAPAIAGAPPNGAIALSPDAARIEILLLMAFAGLFWLSVYLTRRPENAYRLLWCLIIAGTGYAAYGLVAEWLDGRHVLWLDKTAYLGSVTGPFINRNAFGGYAAMILVVALSLLLTRLNRRLRARARARRRGDSGDRPTPRLLGGAELLLIAALLILLTAVLLSQSRGALLALLFGCGIIGLGLAVQPRRRRAQRHWRALLPGFGLGAAALFVLLLALFGGDLLDRFSALDERAQGRAAIHGFTLERIAERPLLGAGLGAFPAVFRAYAGPDLLQGWGGPATVVFYHAHNGYLEFAAEAGLPALLLLLSGYAVLARACWQALARRRTQIVYPLAALGAMAVMGLHALVDFSVEIPAVAASFAALLGCGYAHSFSRAPRRKRLNPVQAPPAMSRSAPGAAASAPAPR